MLLHNVKFNITIQSLVYFPISIKEIKSEWLHKEQWVAKIVAVISFYVIKWLFIEMAILKDLILVRHLGELIYSLKGIVGWIQMDTFYHKSLTYRQLTLVQKCLHYL